VTQLVVIASVAAALFIFGLIVKAMRAIDAEWRPVVDIIIPEVRPQSGFFVRDGVLLHDLVQRPTPQSTQVVFHEGPKPRRLTGIYAIDPLPGTPIATLADHVAAARARGVTQIAMPVDLFEQMCSIAKRHDVLLRNGSA